MAANPRAAAVAALVRQEQDGFSNLVLDAELKRQQLEGRDKAFASAIFYTVLEHRGTLDYILCQFLPKGLAKLDAPVREILRAALAQARYMQVPVSAAVNEAVKLTRAFKKSSASGLVNAVLRKACSYDLSTASFKNEVERLMVLGSAGRDVAEFLHKNYPDEALDILTYKADGGMTSLRANPLKGSADELCAKLLASGAKEAKRGIVPGSVLARFEGSPAENELFRQGYFHVEGQASQLAALCVDAQPGETVIDLCAAPGGKTILLAEQMALQLRCRREPRGPDPHGSAAHGPYQCGSPVQRCHKGEPGPAAGRPHFSGCALQRPWHSGKKAGSALQKAGTGPRS